MIRDLFSKRQKRIRGEVPDVYVYDELPSALRVQFVHIMDEVLTTGYFRDIRSTLCREYGKLYLWKQSATPHQDLCNFFLNVEDPEKALDVIELSLQLIDELIERHRFSPMPQVAARNAATELNYRFREHGVGYQYESGQLIRVDSEYTHAEVVRPALSILSESIYKGANQEFLNAHEHYRSNRYKECLSECLNAFESCMKSICTERKWEYNDTDTASRLIQILLDEGIIPSFMQAHFTSLKSTLEAGVPTIRNKRSGHGQGPQEVTVPESLAAYALHLTASNILFLARANDELGRSGR